MMRLPDQDTLRELLDYDSETGKLFWRRRDSKWFIATNKRTAEHQARWWNARFAGKEALTAPNSEGYGTGSILGAMCKAHRVIWKLVYGVDADQIDHIDGARMNNRIENLRDVDGTLNAQNHCLIKGSKTGVLGVTLNKYGRYVTRIGVGGKNVHLGIFRSIEEAAAARVAASEKYGYHENHGRAA